MERKVTKSDLLRKSSEVLDNMKTICKVPTGFTALDVCLLAEILTKFNYKISFDETLTTLALAYKVVFTEGVLLQRELRIFVEHGIPLVSFISEYYKISEEGFYRLLEERLISFKDVKINLIRILFSV